MRFRITTAEVIVMVLQPGGSMKVTSLTEDFTDEVQDHYGRGECLLVASRPLFSIHTTKRIALEA